MNKAQKLVRAIKILEDIQGEGKVEISAGHDVIYLGDSSFGKTRDQSDELDKLGVLMDLETDSYYILT